MREKSILAWETANTQSVKLFSGFRNEMKWMNGIFIIIRKIIQQVEWQARPRLGLTYLLRWVATAGCVYREWAGGSPRVSARTQHICWIAETLCERHTQTATAALCCFLEQSRKTCRGYCTQHLTASSWMEAALNPSRPSCVYSSLERVLSRSVRKF